MSRRTGLALAQTMVCLVSAFFWIPGASADLIEIRATGIINAGRDARCLFGDDTCIPGSQDGFLFADGNVSIESAWTFETTLAPADIDDRPTNSQRFAATNWLDLYLRVFDDTTSFEFFANSFVSEPDSLFGQLNVTNEVSESIFVDARYQDGFGATDPTLNILRSDMGIGIVDQLMSDELTESFVWQSGIDLGAGGFGEFDVFQCDASQGCTFEMDGTYEVSLLTVTNLSGPHGPIIVPEPSTLSLFASGLLLLLHVQRRRKQAI